MLNKSWLMAIAGVALLLGVTVSGCRDKRTAMAPSRASGGTARPGVRPAEVLSATIRRPPRGEGTASLVVPAAGPVVMAENIYVQPVHQPVTYAAAPIPVTATHVAAAPLPAAYPEPAYRYQEPPRAMPGPELAMARATLPAPAPVPASRPIPPIPELEPVRLRVPAPVTTSRPVAEIMMSQTPDSQEFRQALAPLQPPPAVDAGQGWVPSPVTAMRF
ncbi:MAG: hypothetical protein LIP77_11200 [Planctomycetes bacterium]|nr:hypothetical protein [Planctomycetota bacterium]